MKNDDRFGTLDALDNWQLEHREQDIRGYPLVSAVGERYGVIADMLVDIAKEHVAAIRLEDGRICGVNYLEIADDHVIYREPEPNYLPIYHRVSPREV